MSAAPGRDKGLRQQPFVGSSNSNIQSHINPVLLLMLVAASSGAGLALLSIAAVKMIGGAH